MEELIGETISKIEIGGHELFGDETLLRFSNDKESFIYLVEGDCCSCSFFSEIINLDFLMNNKINSGDWLEMPHYEDGNCRQEVDQFYGYKLTTKAGDCTIVFRNSSNGYYGGWCQYVKDKEINERAAYNKKSPNINWKDISNLPDWTAYEITDNCYLYRLKFPAFM